MLPTSFAVVTLSTRASQGIYEDKSGSYLVENLQRFCQCEGEYHLLADDKEKLLATLTGLTKKKVDLIFTTGGTGIGSCDFTVEVVLPLLNKQIPGVMEFIRNKYGEGNRHALLSRGVCGLSGKSLIFTLPGSLRAAREYWQEIEPLLLHMLQMKADIDSHEQI